MRLKYLISSLAVASIVLLAASSGQAGILDGLNAYWNMNGNANDTAGNFVGNASAVADDGSIVPARGRAVDVAFGPGKFGDAAIFDGGNSYVAVPDSVDLQKGGQDLSISAWFRVDAFDTSWQALIAKGEGSNYRIARQGDDANNSMAYAGGGTDLRDGPDVNDGQWHHIVATTQEGGLTAFHIDGGFVEDLSTRNPGQAASIINERSSTPPALWIGNNPGAPGREWNGGIDDVGIWNRVITTDEIGFLYNGGAGNPIPEPASGLMMAIGVLGLFGARRTRVRRRNLAA